MSIVSDFIDSRNQSYLLRKNMCIGCYKDLNDSEVIKCNECINRSDKDHIQKQINRINEKLDTIMGHLDISIEYREGYEIIDNKNLK